MLSNYLKIALRNILKYRGYSFINVIGLAVGVACCVIIMLFVRDELSYDRFNVNADRIYRPVLAGMLNGREIEIAGTPPPMGETLLREMPEIVSYVRLWRGGFPVMRYLDKTFSERGFFWADSTFWEVFSIPLLEGDPKTALARPNSVVLTKATAQKYFGADDPMGKTLNMDNQVDYVVAGVMENIPENSHFHFDFLGSLCSRDDSRAQVWVSNNYYTYLLVNEGTDEKSLDKKLREVTVKYIAPQIKAATGVSLEDFVKAGNAYGYTLQQLTSIHLQSHRDYEIESNGNTSSVYIFSAIALAILLIACINFVNLATAQSERRAKEIGIRKAMGSLRSQLIRQFIVESILMSTFAVLVSAVLVEASIPFFNELSGKALILSLNEIPILLGAAIAVGLLAGSYPAFFLSSFEPVEVLKSDMRKGGHTSLLRTSLVIGQFAVSITLFATTIIMYQQLRYMQTKHLGFDKEQVLVINRTDDLADQLDSFMHEVTSHPNVISATNSNAIPGRQRGDRAFRLVGAPADQIPDLRFMYADYEFADTYKLELAEGRFFSREHPSDSMAVVVNEETAREFGVSDLVGRSLEMPGSEGNSEILHIVGILKDFNYASLHEPIKPLVMKLKPRSFGGIFVSVRLAPGDLSGTIESLERTWHKYAGNEGFDYLILNQYIDRLYRADERTATIASTFTFLAIFIACLGLLGLAAFVTERRTKEVGIRKVLGATESEIAVLLSREFTKWVLLANIIAWPLSYYIMDRWLQEFAYRIDITFWVFIASGVLALLIALLTVSTHAIRAARANPVEALRYE